MNAALTMWQNYKLVVPVFGLLAFAACARPRTIRADELRSKLFSAISLTSETKLFVGQIENNRMTKQFQSGHANYLQEEAARLSQELGQSRMDSAHSHQLRNCSEELDLLVRELMALKAQSDDDKAALAAAGERVETIRQVLEAAMAGL